MKQQPDTIISQLIGSVLTLLIFDSWTCIRNCKHENFSRHLEFQVGVCV